MICVICRQAETHTGPTPVTLARGEFRLVVNSVPARLCPNCGETYVEKEVAERLLRIARHTLEAGLSNVRYEYSTLQI